MVDDSARPGGRIVARLLGLMGLWAKIVFLQVVEQYLLPARHLVI